ncbi:MAG: multicopper oxidase domain-containing protein, partial [Acidimicrobiales bacterium]
MTTTFNPAPTRPSRGSDPDRRPDPEPPPGTTSRGDGWMLFTVLFSGMALIAAVFAVGLGVRAIDEAENGSGGSTPAGNTAPMTQTIHLGEFSITPAAVEIGTGGVITVHNDGSVPHNLAIEGTGLVTPMLSNGQSAELTLDGIEPGTYVLICQVAGHADAGMRGQLTVTAAGGAAATATAPMAGMNHAAGTAMSSAEMDAAMERSIKAFPAKTQGVGAQDLAPTLLADGTKRFELTSSVVPWEVEPGKFVDAWTYNGTVPGPTLRAEPGDKVEVVLHNQLPESTAIHFHGLTTPNSQDGVTYITQPPIKSGETYTYRFTAQATPAVGMYHSHHNAVTQVPNGLAGTFLIGHLPVPSGVTVAQEQVMMVNDAG